MSKYFSKIEYILFGLVIFYAVSTSLFIAAPLFHKIDSTHAFLFNDDFNEGILFLCLFLVINLTISFFIFITQNNRSKKLVVIIMFVFLTAILFALIQWGFINLANSTLGSSETGPDDDIKWVGGFIFPLFLNLILVVFFNEFLKSIIILTNRNKPTKCFAVSNYSLFLNKAKYLIINNTVLLTCNKKSQINIIIFEQFEEELLDFGGEHRIVAKKSIDKNTKDILDDFTEKNIEIITKPNKNAQDLMTYIGSISNKLESPVLCILTNSGIYKPTFKGEIPSYIKYVKKSYIAKEIKDNLLEGTKFSLSEVKEKI